MSTLIIFSLAGFAFAEKGEKGGEAKPGEKVKIKLIFWNYGVETVADNINKFMERYPNIEVEYEDISWYGYTSDMTLRFITDTVSDVIYVNDMWLAAWAEAGWVAPFEDYFPEKVAKYKPRMNPYVFEALRYKGKVYGMPYYNDTYVFLTNAKMLNDAGIKRLPDTWDDVKEMSLTLKGKGIQEYPVIMEFHPEEHSLTNVFYGMVYSFKPNSMFDENLDPIFNKEGTAAYKALDWMNKALNEWKILDPASLGLKEIDVYKSMQGGKGAFTVMEKYTLAEMNAPGTGPWAGEFELVLMPGDSHYTIGSGKFYGMTTHAVRRGEAVIDACGKFMEYFGGESDGKLTIARRWAVENGLGFAYAELYDDPDVSKRFNSWGNAELEREQEDKYATSIEGIKTPWVEEFSQVIRREVHSVLGREKTTLEGLNTMAEEWSKLKGKYSK